MEMKHENIRKALHFLQDEKTNAIANAKELASYLKDTHGKSYHGGSYGEDFSVSCSPSNIKFFNGETDEEVKLTWSQAAKELLAMHAEEQKKELPENVHAHGKNAVTETDSYTQAVALNTRILANAQAAQMSLYEVCKGLKEMRDGKLYKELGYQNFEEYCETEVGIGRRQANKYIFIVDSLGENFGNSNSRNIGVQKLYLLSTLSESDREELTDRVDIEDVTTRQLKSEIDKLKMENRQLNDANRQLTADYSEIIQDCEAAEERASQLEQQVQELESRPIEVTAVSESHEVENMRLAMNKNSAEWSKRYDELQEENLAHERQLHQTYRQQMDDLREEYEQKLANVDCSDYDAMIQAYITSAVDAIKSATRRMIGNGYSLIKLKLALENELRTIQKLEQEESEK